MSWGLYDALIDAIPGDAKVERCLVGLAWTAIQAEGLGLGLAMTMGSGGDHHGVREAGDIAGRSLRDVATWVKSWDFTRAALGLAAINAWCNAPSVLAKRFDLDNAPQDVNAFEQFAPAYAGKVAATIGHFKNVETLEGAAKTHVLERNPIGSDLPDPACEYVLPECAVVFITSVTLTNKTLPRLLALTQDALVTLVGPGTPMHPALFEFGVTALSGLQAPVSPAAFQAVQEGGGLPALRRAGARFMNLTRADLLQQGRAA